MESSEQEAGETPGDTAQRSVPPAAAHSGPDPAGPFPSDPIVAVATARGASALAVVRVSGAGAVALVGSRFSRPGLADAPGHSVHTGWILDAAGERVDQVVVTVFRAPRSATGDDTAEVTTHGGDAAPLAVLRALVGAGARPAAPGEFTQRAFLNGKLDLAQAEAVADLIHATGTRGARAAVAQMQGRIGDAVADVRERLVDVAALLALELDFAEEDVDFADRADLAVRLDAADAGLAELLSTARLGALLRDGARVVLAGRPNAGKSTLANALAGRERSIVSDVPGTTRDAVETDVEIDGLRVRLVDTAGLRDTADAVEAEGARRARAALESADAVLYLADAETGLDADERADLAALAASRPDLPVLRVASRADRVTAPHASLAGALAISGRDAAREPALLDPLRTSLLAALRAEDVTDDGRAVNERHRACLADAQAAVHRAQASLARGTGPPGEPGPASPADADLLALDLRDALHALGLVVGTVTADDVLGAVFSRFCIGK